MQGDGTRLCGPAGDLRGDGRHEVTNAAIYEAKRPPRFVGMPIRGVDYRIGEWGEAAAPPVVYLHGWGDTGTTFQFVVDAFTAPLRIVAPDFRGFGGSGHAGPAYWFPDYLADLDVLLDAISPDDPVVLVGHSMGANVAGLYAGIMPERVSGFVNVEGFGLADSDPSQAPAHYRRWLERSRAMTPFSEFGDFDQLAERIVRRSPRLGEDRAQFVAREWAVRDADGVVRLRADPAHRLPNAVLYRRAEAEACWQQVSAPVLLVSGTDTEFDAALDAWLDRDAARRPFPGAASEVIADCGHMVHFEAPSRLATLIETFVAGL